MQQQMPVTLPVQIRIGGEALQLMKITEICGASTGNADQRCEQYC